MATKPIGLGAGNKLTPADDASGLSGLPAATGLTGQVPQANGGLGVDASALSNGVLVKSGGAMSSTTAPTMSGANITSNSLPGSALTTASVPVAKITGGTLGRLLYDNGTELDYTAVGTSGYLLQSNGGVIAPSWTNTIVGISISGASNTITNLPTSSIAPAFLLAAANGGTGQNTYTIGDVLYASGTTALSRLAAGTVGQVLTANGTGVAPSYQAPVTATTQSATLGATYSLTTTGYEATGLTVSLSAGTWRISANVRTTVQCSAGVGYIRLKLRNNTAAADVATSVRLSALASVTGQAFVDTTPIDVVLTLASTSTIELFAQTPAGPTYTARNNNANTDNDGETHLVAFRIA